VTTDYSAGARDDVDVREHLAEASERLEAARTYGTTDRIDRSPLYALGALADVRANVDAAILILIRQLRLARPPASWDAIGNAVGISKQGAHERFARQIHQDGYL
jgi:hypothetical protein